MKPIHSEVGPHEILVVCDRSSVSHKGYTAIFKTSRTGLWHVDPKLIQYILPNLHQVTLMHHAFSILQIYILCPEHILHVIATC